MKGTILFEDRGGKQAEMSVSEVIDITALETYANFLNTLSCAYPFSATVEQSVNYDGIYIAGIWNSAEEKAIFHLKDTTLTEKNEIVIEIPAPIDGVLEHDTELGFRVVQVMGESMAAAFTAALGHTIVFVSGEHEGKKTTMRL